MLHLMVKDHPSLGDSRTEPNPLQVDAHGGITKVIESQYLEEKDKESPESLGEIAETLLQDLFEIRGKSKYVADRYFLHLPGCLLKNIRGQEVTHTYNGIDISINDVYSDYLFKLKNRKKEDEIVSPYLKSSPTPFSSFQETFEKQPPVLRKKTLDIPIRIQQSIFEESLTSPCISSMELGNHKFGKKPERKEPENSNKESHEMRESDLRIEKVDQDDSSNGNSSTQPASKTNKSFKILFPKDKATKLKIKYIKPLKKENSPTAQKNLTSVSEPLIKTSSQYFDSMQPAKQYPNYGALRKSIEEALPRPGFDDGSLAPNIIRLAWHASATYDKYSQTGGSNGGTMRFPPELTDIGNIGLETARMALEVVKFDFPNVSFADLWTLAAVVAIKSIGGPYINWLPGRVDCTDTSKVPPNGRLPVGSRAAPHIREVFDRMGFNDEETVALIGAHSIGRCHKKYSGWEGAWTKSPTIFSNQFFMRLIQEEWLLGVVPETGSQQYFNKDRSLMMLNTDMELLRDAEFLKYTVRFARDEAEFFRCFAAAFSKLLELGIERDEMGSIVNNIE